MNNQIFFKYVPPLCKINIGSYGENILNYLYLKPIS